MIFALAPVINTIVSLFWQPNVGPLAVRAADGDAALAPLRRHRPGRPRRRHGAVRQGAGRGEARRPPARRCGRRPGCPSDRPGGRQAVTPEEAVRAAQHRAGPRLDGAHVPQARRRDPGRRGAARRAAHRLRLHRAPSSRPGSAATARSICTALRGSCRSCGGWRSCSPRNTGASPTTPISRWPPRR